MAQTLAHERRQVPAFKEVARHAGRLGGLDVADLVADEKASLALDRPALEEIEEHAGVRLAPWVGRAIGGDASFRMVRAIAPVVDRGAFGGKLLRHPAVERFDRLFLVESFGDARLIGDDEDVTAGVVQELHRLLGAADPRDLMRRVDIAVVDVEDSVAIEEDGRPAALARDQFGGGGKARRHADVDEKAGIRVGPERAAGDEARQDVFLERRRRGPSFEGAAGKIIDSAIDQGGSGPLASPADRLDEAALELDRLIAVRLGDLTQRKRGDRIVLARPDEEVEPVEIEPSVAVQQQKFVPEPREGVDQGPARAERRRLDRQFDTGGEPPFDVALGEEGDDRLAEMPGEQQEVVEAAPPRFAQQGLEKGRSADVEQGLGRGLGLFAEPRSKAADKNRALITQPCCSGLCPLPDAGRRRPAFLPDQRLFGCAGMAAGFVDPVAASTSTMRADRQRQECDARLCHRRAPSR